MYITPRVLINQEFLQTPVYSQNALPAFVIGPNYALTRYSNVLEKPSSALSSYNGEVLLEGNAYNSTADTTYDFPNVPTGASVDHTYTKVFAENVEALYFPLEALGGSGMGGNNVSLVESPSGAVYSNKVRFTGVTLKTANGFTRSSYFSNRDVVVGDVIKLTDDLGNVTKAKIKALETEKADVNSSLESTIAAQVASGNDGATSGATFTSASANFIASEVVGKYLTISGVTGTPGVFKIVDSPDSNTLTLNSSVASYTGKSWYVSGVYNSETNAGLQIEDYNNSPVSVGTSNSTVDVINTSTAYKGYASKNVLADTYTVTVTTGGSETDARFTITSENGVFAPRTNVALDSGDLLIDSLNGNGVQLSFSASGMSPVSFANGNAWSVAVTAPVTPITPETAGTYTGSVDMIYTLRVDRGGPFFDGTNASSCAKVSISASDVDTSSVVLPQEDVYFNVGGYGVTAAFTSASNNGGLIAGDVYYIPVTSEKVGPTTVVELSESLPGATLELSSYITAELFLTQKSIQISEIKDLVTDERNWTQEDSYITIKSDITTYDAALVAAGEPARLPVKYAKLFVEHRDLLPTYTLSIDSVTSLSEVSSKLGAVHPDNPLAQGVYEAVLNAQNQRVYFIAVGTDDLAGYTEAIRISEKSDKVYSFAPLSFDKSIQDAVVSHVNAYSTAAVGRWRIAWLALEDKKFAFIYESKEDGSSYQATVTDDPIVSGTQVRLVTIEGAAFLDDGVRAGDSIRINFRLNADGKLIYDEYFVQQVRTNTTLTITKSLASPITAPTKIQVIRNYTRSERASRLAAIADGYNNRRVRCVFPDTYKYAGVVKQGYFAAAGLAGLRSGVVPHQGLTNTEYSGADDLSKVVIEFSQGDLDTMAEKGVWLLTQEVVGATPYVRHQLTSFTDSLNTSEDSITTNVDSISYALKKVLEPFVGRYNVNLENVAVIRAAIVDELTFRATGTFTARAGNQLTSFTPKDDILKIEQDATFKDRIVVAVRLNVPYPLNYLDLTLLVG